jgi:folate-binding protein YgfZ
MQPYEGAAAVLAAHPLGSLPRVLLLAPAPLAPRLAEALLGAGARLAGYEAFDECRLWARVPRFGADFPADFLPAEAALYTHIAFDKGCYVGQEVHARQHYRGHANRKLVSVDVPENIAQAMQAGARLFLGGEDVGALTSLSRQARPRAGDGEPVRRGIAVVRYAVAVGGAPLSAQADAAATIAVAPLATDLGVAKR